jgi:putative hydrolase of the HAD superfamily
MNLVVFDMGNVFIDFNWYVVCAAFAGSTGIPRDRFDKLYEYVGNLGYEKGHISTEDFIAELNRLLKLKLDISQFTQVWNASFAEDKDMRLLMDQLAQRWPLYLLSNTNENHFSYLQERFDVARHFKEMILSFEVGHAKPETEIYEEIAKRSGFVLADCLFIDDLEPNIEAAQRLGMNTILYRGIEDLRHQLPKFGVTV